MSSTQVVVDETEIPALLEKYGSLRKIWRFHFKQKVGYTSVRRAFQRAVAYGLIDKDALPDNYRTRDDVKSYGQVHELPTVRFKSREGVAHRYLLTCAQNNTNVHAGFWTNLLALAEHYSAEIHVSRFVYLTSAIASVYDKTLAFERLPKDEKEEIWWAAELEPYLSDNRMELAPSLIWCGEMNILPTAVNPLSGLEVYTGRKSSVLPHVKIAMESIPSTKYEPTKFNYTTGTVTLRNYIQRKAGLKAEFHHSYGALLVEVDTDGEWWCRQILADEFGTIHDLDIKVENGEVTTGNTVLAITWGDIHAAQLDPVAFQSGWLAYDSIIDTLQPQYQFLHDVLDFRAKSHHELKMPHRLYRRYLLGETDVKRECEQVGNFLDAVERPWCHTVIVDSNHHHHLGRWLEESDARYDPKNVEIWLRLSMRVVDQLKSGYTVPDYFQVLLDEIGFSPKWPEQFKVLKQDESFVICEEHGGGIECGMHGDSGPNGARGSAKTFRRIGRKINRGHDHTASIYDGIYTVGTCSSLTPDWTKGPSSWSCTHAIVYPNGKRSLITMRPSGKWRLE
jgi:hypothetical protein